MSCIKVELGTIHQEKPVASPRDVACDHANVRYINRHLGAISIRWNILNSNRVIIEEFCFNISDCGFNAMNAGLDAPQIRKAYDQSNGPVAAHL